MKTNKEILVSIVNKAIDANEFILVIAVLQAFVFELPHEEVHLLSESLKSLYSRIHYSSNMEVDYARRMVHAAIDAVFIVIEKSKHSCPSKQ